MIVVFVTALENESVKRFDRFDHSLYRRSSFWLALNVLILDSVAGSDRRVMAVDSIIGCFFNR